MKDIDLLCLPILLGVYRNAKKIYAFNSKMIDENYYRGFIVIDNDLDQSGKKTKIRSASRRIDEVYPEFYGPTYYKYQRCRDVYIFQQTEDEFKEDFDKKGQYYRDTVGSGELIYEK